MHQILLKEQNITWLKLDINRVFLGLDHKLFVNFQIAALRGLVEAHRVSAGALPRHQRYRVQLVRAWYDTDASVGSLHADERRPYINHTIHRLRHLRCSERTWIVPHAPS